MKKRLSLLFSIALCLHFFSDKNMKRFNKRGNLLTLHVLKKIQGTCQCNVRAITKYCPIKT